LARNKKNPNYDYEETQNDFMENLNSGLFIFPIYGGVHPSKKAIVATG